MSLANILRGELDARLGGWKAERERLLASNSRISELDLLIQQTEALLDAADNNREASVPVEKRERPKVATPVEDTPIEDIKNG